MAEREFILKQDVSDIKRIIDSDGRRPVSYTHLDVYKRQSRYMDDGYVRSGIRICFRIKMRLN